MNPVVTTVDLTKHYGRIKAVEKLSCSIPEKSVFGILGPNGSGKTTTLGMLLDVINPTSGTYSWFGNPPDKKNLQKIGSILETPSFYPYLTAVDNLKIIAGIKNCGYQNIEEVLKMTGIYDRRFSSFRTFSLGMKQRLALAAALLADPRVLILDEPTNGLDPKGIAEMRELIKTIAGQGKTIILASHLLDEVQKVCSHFAVLNKGVLIYSGLVNETRQELSLEIAAENNSALAAVLSGFPHPIKIEERGENILVNIGGNVSVSELSRFIFEKGVVITHLVAQKKSLEDQFLEIVNQQA
ncbi:MAG TPA: ATP-binding cassette domain-containing protein [Bacteroidales bacterium]|nr:ATP-binding cassette domain-containing protein [Bacteroidales bacterium]